MNFVYFGSFHLSADILEELVAGGFTPSAVICSPDRPAGRKHIITPPAIKQLILEKGWDIKILQPETLDLPAGRQEFGNWKLEIGEVDLAVVMGYPKIIPEEIINLPRLGTIGVHPSLLPKYRGASPIQTALLNDEVETGVTLYQMDAKMDHGGILASRKTLIASRGNQELEKHLAKIAAELLIETLPAFVAGKIQPVEQNHKEATFTHKFTTADGEVDMTHDSQLTIYNKIRAFNPEPSVWTMNFPGHIGKRVKLLAAEWRQSVIPAKAGIQNSKLDPRVKPEDDKRGVLKITKIQIEGKTPISI